MRRKSPLKRRGDSLLIFLPSIVGKQVQQSLGWRDFETLEHGWSWVKRGTVEFRFWRVSDGRDTFRRVLGVDKESGGKKEQYVITIGYFPLALRGYSIKRITKDESPWLDPELVLEFSALEVG